MTAATLTDDARRYAPDVMCEHCGSRNWGVIRSRMSDRTAAHVRVRVYECKTCHQHRLYTHERLTRPPRLTALPKWCVIFTLEDHPCSCGCNRFLMCAAGDPSGFPLMRYSYTCQSCSAVRHTAEYAIGQTEGATPRHLRGRRRHRYLP